VFDRERSRRKENTLGKKRKMGQAKKRKGLFPVKESKQEVEAQFSTKNVMESKKVKQFDPWKISFLVVDDDPNCLNAIVKMLEKFHNKVYGYTSGAEALSVLRGGKVKIDIALVDILMPDMDGFKLLEIIGLEICIPVVLMSVESTNSNVLKGVTYGAVDFLSKPVRSEDLKFLWQHALSKIVVEEKQKNGTKKDKKPRIIWTPELHQRFVDAVNTLGVDKAVPKKIKELMGVQFLQREHIASHLQKYRLFLKQSPNIVMPHLEAPSNIMLANSGRLPTPTVSLPTPTNNIHGVNSHQEHLLYSADQRHVFQVLAAQNGHNMEQMATYGSTNSLQGEQEQSFYFPMQISKDMQ